MLGTLGERSVTPAQSPNVIADAEALELAEAPASELPELLARARAIRDRRWGRTITFSPKAFLPITNLCKNRCSYCSFRKSPSQTGAWTMTPAEVTETLDRARATGCVEALFCLGDKPETVFPTYRAQLETWSYDGTVDYLYAAGRVALERGLLPHTNAGLLTKGDMARLKEVNVSLGLMLESASARLCEPGMPHYSAPDKRPALRLKMIDEAGELAIPFTTGILVGIGETRRERAEALLAIRASHRKHGHIQEVIVQSFRARDGIAMHAHAEPTDDDVSHAIALARLILDEDVSVQAPPNLNIAPVEQLLEAGVNDLGGISPLTPDYINPRHPWPHLDRLADEHARLGYSLAPRMPIYDAYVERPGFLHPDLAAPTAQVQERLARVERPADLAPGAPRTRDLERRAP
jgi:FO synthase